MHRGDEDNGGMAEYVANGTNDIGNGIDVESRNQANRKEKKVVLGYKGFLVMFL